MPLCAKNIFGKICPHARLSFGRKFIFIFLNKPASNLLRDAGTGELGEDFPPLFVLFYPFAVRFLAAFWISCWL